MSGLRVKPVYSLLDPVGLGVAKILEKEYGVDVCEREDCALPGFEIDTPYMDELGELLPGYDGYVIISRHSSASGKPTLSIHHTGNPGSDALGGKPFRLEWAWPRLAYLLYITYKKVAQRLNLLEKYQFTLEATHHGPTEVPKPVVFIEIGSTEREWKDEKALRALAETVYTVLLSGKLELPECTPVSGFGDTHYPRIHTRLVEEKCYCYAHIISKHFIKSVKEEVVRQAFNKSVDKVEKAVITKIPGSARRLVESVARELGIEIERLD